jgi:ABC-2 type transport system permease protein
MTTQAARFHGPSALGEDARRFLQLTVMLARTEFKLRYFGSVLGYAWSLMRPLLFFGVIYLFFTKIINLSKGVPHYGLYLLTGIVLWNYLAESTGNCVACLVSRESMLRKVRFPRMVIPLSVSLTATFNLAANFVTVLVFAFASGVFPAVSWLELLPIVLGFIVLATGLGMLLSAAYVRFRDVQPIWDVALQAWFYLSPIMYLATAYGAHFGHGVAVVAMMNPTAMLVSQAGHAFVDSQLPTASSVAGVASTVVAISLILLVFAIGWAFFTREAPRVAENL